MTNRKGWVVMVNAPGYLPDDEPMTYPVFSMAFLALIEEMTKSREALYDDNTDNGADERLQDAVDAACNELQEHGAGDMSIQLYGLAHCIQRAT
jgi:hypothetical protein